MYLIVERYPGFHVTPYFCFKSCPKERGDRLLSLTMWYNSVQSIVYPSKQSIVYPSKRLRF